MTGSSSQGIKTVLHPVSDVKEPAHNVGGGRLVASASADGAACRVPLSFEWDGEALLTAA